MIKKFRVLLVFISLSVCLCMMSSTYSRYVAATTGNIDVLFAKWQILVNETDITNSSSSTITFVPTIEENEYVADNVIAPSSKGHFDIYIDPTNVDVSFNYLINLGIANENMPDLMITKYAILDEDYIEGDIVNLINIDNNVIEDTLIFDKENESFQFNAFTIRVYFEWYEGENELMSDSEDSTIGNQAAVDNMAFAMNANISFQQIFE